MDRFTQNDPERQANIAFALIFLGIIAVGAAAAFFMEFIKQMDAAVFVAIVLFVVAAISWFLDQTAPRATARSQDESER